MDAEEQTARGIARTPWDALIVLSIYSACDDTTRWIVAGLRLDDPFERSYAKRSWKTVAAAQRACGALIAHRRDQLAPYDNYKWERDVG